MNYKMHYDALVSKAIGRSGVYPKERHHVVPKCIGGSDDESNVVELTPEEHYTAHLLLAKIHSDNSKLVFAAHRMTSGKRRSNKLYGWLRKAAADALSKNNPMNSESARAAASERMTARNKVFGNPMKRKDVLEKIAESGKSTDKPIVCIEEGKSFRSRSEAARWLSELLGKKAHAQCLTSALNSGVAAYGFHWRYA